MKKLTSLSLTLCSLLPATTFAAIQENTTDTSVADFLNRIKNYLLGFVGALAVFFIIYGGVQMLTSAGNPKKLETAKKTLTYAIVGLVIVLLSQGIYLVLTNVMSNVFGAGSLSF